MTDEAWDTACLDWEARLLAGKHLVPALPLFAEEAARAIRIFRRLKLPDVVGTPTLAEACGEWFFPIVEAMFGSYDPATNRRMISEFFELIPKKNSKSSNGGAVMVVAMIVNRRPKAEGLLIAPTKEISDIAFGQAEGMIRLDPELTKLFHIQRHIKTITHRRSGAVLKIKAADTDAITGSKSTYTMVDETHVFGKRSDAAQVFVELRGALAARPDGFLFQTTTQSKAPPSGVFKQEVQRARDVRDGKLRLPRPLLPILYELPASLGPSAWKQEANWGLVNPNLGRSVDKAYLQSGLLDAERDGPAQLALFASQHFNVEIGIGLRSDGWAGAELWDRGLDESLTLESLLERSEAVTVGIDGGGLDDLLGVAVLGREKQTKCWLGWARAFISPEGLERRKANRPNYDDFEAEGDLVYSENIQKSLPGLVEIVSRVRDSGLLAQVGADTAGLGIIVDALAEIGVSEEDKNLIGVRQGIGLMGAIKAIEWKLAEGSFLHANQPLMNWCAGNAIVQPTATGMRIVRDASGYGKIDPLMALFDAAALMSMNPEAAGSVYEERGLMVFS